MYTAGKTNQNKNMKNSTPTLSRCTYVIFISLQSFVFSLKLMQAGFISEAMPLLYLKLLQETIKSFSL